MVYDHHEHPSLLHWSRHVHYLAHVAFRKVFGFIASCLMLFLYERWWLQILCISQHPCQAGPCNDASAPASFAGFTARGMTYYQSVGWFGYAGYPNSARPWQTKQLWDWSGCCSMDLYQRCLGTR
jgi:hypothetical protein